jgi:hypothetical protein
MINGAYNDQNMQMDAISNDLDELMLPTCKKMSSFSENNMRDPNCDSTNHTVMPPALSSITKKKAPAPKTSTSLKFKSKR